MLLTTNRSGSPRHVDSLPAVTIGLTIQWACHDYSTGQICDAAQVEAFMKTAITYFKSSGLVERWAWFGAFPDMARLAFVSLGHIEAELMSSNGNANGIMNLDGTINAVGKVYLSL